MPPDTFIARGGHGQIRRDRILVVGVASGGRLGMAYERHEDFDGVSRLVVLKGFSARDAQPQ